jgi:hypothetical protein
MPRPRSRAVSIHSTSAAPSGNPGSLTTSSQGCAGACSGSYQVIRQPSPSHRGPETTPVQEAARLIVADAPDTVNAVKARTRRFTAASLPGAGTCGSEAGLRHAGVPDRSRRAASMTCSAITIQPRPTTCGRTVGFRFLSSVPIHKGSGRSARSTEVRPGADPHPPAPCRRGLPSKTLRTTGPARQTFRAVSWTICSKGARSSAPTIAICI